MVSSRWKYWSVARCLRSADHPNASQWNAQKDIFSSAAFSGAQISTNRLFDSEKSTSSGEFAPSAGTADKTISGHPLMRIGSHQAPPGAARPT
jgi:hypothetical protein